MRDVLRARVVERGRTRWVRLALALTIVATLSAVVAAAARALAIDDVRPCPAAYQEDTGETGIVPPFVCPEGVVGNPYAVQLVGHGSCEPFYRFTVVGGAPPPGVSLSTSGSLTGTPTRAGSWSFRVRVQDVNAALGGPAWCTSSDQAEGEFTIAVRQGVVVTTETTEPATVGAFYDLALSAQLVSGPAQLAPPAGCADGEAALGRCPLTWSLVQGQLPAGLRLNSVTGVISGTPTAEASQTFVVRAALDDGRAGTRSLTMDVRRPLALQAPKPFAVGSPTLWEVGVTFSAKLGASGGSGTYSWSLATGALPGGLALAPNGTIAGRPRAAGSFQALIRVRDDEGRAAEYQALFRVAPRLAIRALELRPGHVGRSYRARLSTTGGIQPTTWAVKSGRLPAGLRLERTAGVLVGRPTRPGRYRVTIEAKDRLGVRSARTLVVDVLA